MKRKFDNESDDETVKIPKNSCLEYIYLNMKYTQYLNGTPTLYNETVKIPSTLRLGYIYPTFKHSEVDEYVKDKQIIKGTLYSPFTNFYFNIYLKINFNQNEAKNICKISNLMLTPYLGKVDIISLPGEYDLSTFIVKLKTKLSENSILELLLDIVTQIRILEEHKWIHNNIEPTNIIYLGNRWYFINYQESKNYSSLNEECVCLNNCNYRYINTDGTREFFAPEKKEYGKLSVMNEIYSFGYTLLKCLRFNNNVANNKREENKIEMDEDNLSEEIIDKILNESDLNENIKLLIKQMLEFDFKKRIKPIELLQKLEELIGKEIINQTRIFYQHTSKYSNRITMLLMGENY